jgi:hypothetical protein
MPACTGTADCACIDFKTNNLEDCWLSAVTSSVISPLAASRRGNAKLRSQLAPAK